MHTTHSPVGSTTAPHPSLRGLWNGLAQRLEQLTPHHLIALAARLALAGIFWMSGRTKVEGGSPSPTPPTCCFARNTSCR